MSRTAVISVLAALLVAAGVPVALAHTEVKSASPGKNKTAKTSRTRVTVTFTQTLRSGTLRIVGPDGKKASIGKGGRDPRKVSRLLVGLKKNLKAGSYKASWTIVAADGHHQKGSYRFRLKR